jgi:hemerythrin-like metal-binding protein
MNITWAKKYNIGIKEIDDQHRHYIYLVHKIKTSVYQKKPKEEIGNLIDEVFNHVSKHFATEEEYFDKFHYNRAKEHINEHRKLTVKALDFKYRFEEEGMKITPDFMDFLENWMADHIYKHDKKYGEYLKKFLE